MNLFIRGRKVCMLAGLVALSLSVVHRSQADPGCSHQKYCGVTGWCNSSCHEYCWEEDYVPTSGNDEFWVAAYAYAEIVTTKYGEAIVYWEGDGFDEVWYSYQIEVDCYDNDPESYETYGTWYAPICDWNSVVDGSSAVCSHEGDDLVAYAFVDGTVWVDDEYGGYVWAESRQYTYGGEP